MVIGTDCIGNCKSNQNKITTTTALPTNCNRNEAYLFPKKFKLFGFFFLSNRLTMLRLFQKYTGYLRFIYVYYILQRDVCKSQLVVSDVYKCIPQDRFFLRNPVFFHKLTLTTSAETTTNQSSYCKITFICRHHFSCFLQNALIRGFLKS